MFSNTTQWVKSSYSQINGNCLEAAFRKSSHSTQGGCLEAAWHRSSWSAVHNCTEAAIAGDLVLVRDSKLAPLPGCQGPSGPVLSFSPADWVAFMEGIKQ